ncbi:hypothetical protein ACFX5K_01220 [Rickettsiales bacterium LUAb2]
MFFKCKHKHQKLIGNLETNIEDYREISTSGHFEHFTRNTVYQLTECELCEEAIVTKFEKILNLR